MPILISLQTAFVATALALICGVTLAAWRVHRRSPWLVALDAACLLPLVLPPTVIGFLLLLTFGRRSPIGSILEQIGFPLVFSWPGTVLAAFVVSFPIVYLLSRSAFLTIDPALRDASRLLGVSPIQRLLQIDIPIVRASIATAAVLAFARALGEFGATLMLAGNIPGRTRTMPIAIYSAVESGDLNTAVTLSLILVVLSTAVVLVANRFAWK
ncbi:MAG: molybdate ABC transporter permease subunit [Chthoniobacterales bacterium]